MPDPLFVRGRCGLNSVSVGFLDRPPAHPDRTTLEAAINRLSAFGFVDPSDWKGWRWTVERDPLA